MKNVFIIGVFLIVIYILFRIKKRRVFQKPDIYLESFDIPKIDNWKMSGYLKYNVQNSNNYPINLYDITLDFYSGSAKLGTFKRNELVKIPARKDITVPVAYEIDIARAIMNLGSMIEKNEIGVKGNFTVGTNSIKLNFNINDTIKLS